VSSSIGRFRIVEVSRIGCRKNSILRQPRSDGKRPAAEQRLNSWSNEIRMNRFFRISVPGSGFRQRECDAGQSADDNDDHAGHARIPHVRNVVDGQMVPPDTEKLIHYPKALV